MRACLPLIVLAACDALTLPYTSCEDQDLLDERCAGQLQLERDGDDLRIRVVDPLVNPESVSVNRLLSCDESSSTFEQVWWVEDVAAELVGVGLIYGVVPEGAVEKHPVVPLVEGETYALYLEGPDRHSSH